MVVIAGCHEIIDLVYFAVIYVEWIIFVLFNVAQILLVWLFALNLVIIMRLIPRRSLGPILRQIDPVIRLIQLFILLSFVASISAAKIAGAHAHCWGSRFPGNALVDVEFYAVGPLQVRFIRTLRLAFLRLLTGPSIFALFVHLLF